MPAERITFDPLTESSTNSPLEIADGSDGIYLLSHAYPPPARDIQWVGSASTEGEAVGNAKYQNRELSLTVRVREPQDAAATNLVLNPRPGSLTDYDDSGTFYINSTDVGGPDFITDTDGYPSIRFQTDASPGQQGVRYNGLSAATFTNGTTYYFWIMAKAASAGAAGLFFGAAAAQQGVNADIAGSGSISLTTEYAWYSCSFTPSADRTGVVMGLKTLSAGAANTFYMRRLLVSTVNGPYFDGDTPGCKWTGALHASTSTRPAPGGPRRDGIVSDLQQKMAKIVREGGTLRRRSQSGTMVTFDLLDGEHGPGYDNAWLHSGRSEGEIKLTAKPFGRGAETTLSDHTETTLPYIAFTETGIPGDVPALGKLVVDEDDGDDQQFLMWGIRSRNYSSSANAALFYQAEGRTALSTSATAAGATGASGSGSNVMRNTDLIPSWQAIMSTQATGGGAHLSHVGTYRVWARTFRPTGNTGAVSVRLSWSEGDFRSFTNNTATAFEADDSREGQFVLVDLGLVYLTQAVQGTQQWQGRIEAKSTVVGDEIDIDCLFIMPVDEGYGEVRGVQQIPSPATLSARDEFDQSAGSLTGKTAAVGGVWAGAGDADDFTVNATAHTIERSVVSDSGSNNELHNGRFAVSGVSAFTTQAVQVDSSILTPFGMSQGVVARYVATTDFLAAVLKRNASSAPVAPTQLYIIIRVGSSLAVLNSASVPGLANAGWATVRLAVSAAGSYFAWAYVQGGVPGLPICAGQHSALATGGALASGKPGIIDHYTLPGSANLRAYDNFAAWVPTLDAAMFASQSAEWRHDRVIREDSAGSIWPTPSRYEGDYLKIPPAGREGRTLEVIVKGSRFDPDSGPDSGIDDISARLTYVPRYLQVPDA